MSLLNAAPAPTGRNPRRERKVWHWHPELPIKNAEIFAWPPNPITIVKTLSSYWLNLSGRVIILVLSIASWYFFQPSMEQAKDFELGWMAHIYFRNLALLVVLATALHLYFHTFRMQGMELRFDAREMVKDHAAFTFRNQLYDNVFWSLASGLTIWTAYEILFMWAYANGYIASLTWDESPVWFVAMFVLIPIWYSFYFYWVHRAEHWPPLYRLAHALHHRNINVGPWSGLSMHPVEHLLYIGSPIIHLVVPSHPLHVIFHLQFTVLISVITHTGYDGLLVRGKRVMEVGYFFHQLHHRYFDCNYGTDEMPWDKWFHTFHDGTPEATEAMRQRRRAA